MGGAGPDPRRDGRPTSICLLFPWLCMNSKAGVAVSQGQAEPAGKGSLQSRARGMRPRHEPRARGSQRQDPCPLTAGSPSELRPVPVNLRSRLGPGAGALQPKHRCPQLSASGSRGQPRIPAARSSGFHPAPTSLAVPRAHGHGMGRWLWALPKSKGTSADFTATIPRDTSAPPQGEGSGREAPGETGPPGPPRKLLLTHPCTRSCSRKFPGLGCPAGLGEGRADVPWGGGGHPRAVVSASSSAPVPGRGHVPTAHVAFGA